MSHVVMHVWRVSRAAVVPAVLRMAVDRLHLSSAPGLGFSKPLGTGDGRTFDVRDADVRTWALLTTSESAAASREFEGHRTPVAGGASPRRSTGWTWRACGRGAGGAAVPRSPSMRRWRGAGTGPSPR